MSTVSFTWVPDPAVHAAAIDRVALALRNHTAPLVAASEVIQDDIRERFMTETGPDGSYWPDWSESYWPKANEYPNEGLLRQSGELFDAATSSEAVVVSGDTVFYNTQLLPHYGLAHDQGLPDRKTPLPQREFLGVSEEAQMVIFGAFSEWFDQSIALYPTSTGKVGMRHAIHGAGGLFVSRSSVGKGPL